MGVFNTDWDKFGSNTVHGLQGYRQSVKEAVLLMMVDDMKKDGTWAKIQDGTFNGTWPGLEKFKAKHGDGDTFSAMRHKEPHKHDKGPDDHDDGPDSKPDGDGPDHGGHHHHHHHHHDDDDGDGDGGDEPLAPEPKNPTTNPDFLPDDPDPDPERAASAAAAAAAARLVRRGVHPKSHPKSRPRPQSPDLPAIDPGSQEDEELPPGPPGWSGSLSARDLGGDWYGAGAYHAPQEVLALPVGLSGDAAVGLALGCTVALAAVVVLVVMLWRRSRRGQGMA